MPTLHGGKYSLRQWTDDLTTYKPRNKIHPLPPGGNIAINEDINISQTNTILNQEAEKYIIICENRNYKLIKQNEAIKNVQLHKNWEHAQTSTIQNNMETIIMENKPQTLV